MDGNGAWVRQGEGFWQVHHEAWKRSGLNQQQYCEFHGLHGAVRPWRAIDSMTQAERRERCESSYSSPSWIPILAALPDDVETLQKLERSLAAERASISKAQTRIERIIEKLRANASVRQNWPAC